MSEAKRWTGVAGPAVLAGLSALAILAAGPGAAVSSSLPSPPDIAAGGAATALAAPADAAPALHGGGPAGGVTAAGASIAQNPVVQFTTPGVHTVTLKVCNSAGCATLTQQVNVLDPTPAAGSAAAAPAQVYAGQPVYLSGQASGQPPLTYSWQIFQVGLLGSTQVQALSGQAPTWSTAGLAAGGYTVQLTVSNASGSTTANVPVTVLPVVPNHFYTLTPCRLLDTRTTQTPLLAAAAVRLIQVGGLCGVPLGARSVALNITAVNASTAGGITLYPADYPSGLASSIDFAAGGVKACGAVLPLSSDGLGQLAATAALASGQVQLVIDVSGYFAP